MSRWVRCRCLLRPPCAVHPLGICRCLPPPADPSPARHTAARVRGRDAKNEIRDPTFSNFRGLRGKLDADPRWRREGARARGRVKPRGRTFRRPPYRAMYGSGGGDADRWDTGSEIAERWGLPWGSRPPPPPAPAQAARLPARPPYPPPPDVPASHAPPQPRARASARLTARESSVQNTLHHESLGHMVCQKQSFSRPSTSPPTQPAHPAILPAPHRAPLSRTCALSPAA